MKKNYLLSGLFLSLMATGQTPAPTDTYMNFPLDGNATEISGNNFTGTMNGGVTSTSDRLGNTSAALEFDGKTGYIDIPCNSKLGTADFTVSYWAAPAEGNTGYVFTKEQTMIPDNQFRMGGNGEYFGCFSDSTISIGGGLPFYPNEVVWSFYTIIREGDSINLFVNGVKKSILKTSIPINHTNALNYRIGTMYESDSYYKGKIDDLKMFRRALSSDEVNALYTKNNNAMSFDGENDFIELPQNPLLNFSGSSSISVSAWVNPASSSAPIYSKLTGSTHTLEFSFNIAENKLHLGFDDLNSSGWLQFTSDAAVLSKHWSHVAFTLNNGIAKLYINGMSDKSLTFDAGHLSAGASTGITTIGGNGIQYQYGSLTLDEVSIWNKTLSDAEILTLASGSVLSGNETGLIVYYPFKQGKANGNNADLTTLIDFSNSGVNATLHNFALSGLSSNWIPGFEATIPGVSTLAVSEIKATSAIGNGNMVDFGITRPLAYGVCWNTTGSPTTSDNKKEFGTESDLGLFSAQITGITANTKYYVRAFATNLAGTSYGNEVSFTSNVDDGLENTYVNLLTLFPNPATDGFTIDAGNQLTYISIYDSRGSLVLQQQAIGDTFVKISSLLNGLYVIKVNEKIGKFVKN